MNTPLDDSALDQLFVAARSADRFVDRPVDDATLRRRYDLYKWGPTSMNCQPARIAFVRDADAKSKLRPTLSPGNLNKTMAAPVPEIVAYDTAFHDLLPTVLPSSPGARDLFVNDAALAAVTALSNGTLQSAYLILAARALGLDAGPMSGFGSAVVNSAFFSDGRWRANFRRRLEDVIGFGSEASCDTTQLENKK